jgi:hypothetical protein
MEPKLTKKKWESTLAGEKNIPFPELAEYVERTLNWKYLGKFEITRCWENKVENLMNMHGKGVG